MQHCKKCSEYHRKIQKLEGQLQKLQKRLDKLNTGVNTWASKERQLEAIQRDKQMEAIKKANANEILR